MQMEGPGLQRGASLSLSGFGWKIKTYFIPVYEQIYGIKTQFQPLFSPLYK